MIVYSKRGTRHRILGDSATLGESATVCGAGTRDMTTAWPWINRDATDCKKCFPQLANSG